MASKPVAFASVGFWSPWAKKNELAVLYLPAWARGVAYAALFLGFLWFGEYGGEAFIYFQF